jgi:hypothetical protein
MENTPKGVPRLLRVPEDCGFNSNNVMGHKIMSSLNPSPNVIGQARRG